SMHTRPTQDRHTHGRPLVAGFSRILGVAVDGKVPIEKWEVYQTTPPDDATLARWFSNGHAYNIGIVTGQISRVVAIDIDRPEAKIWAQEHLPFTPMKTKTASGEHWYYKHPGSGELRRGHHHGDGARAAAPERAECHRHPRPPHECGGQSGERSQCHARG